MPSDQKYSIHNDAKFRPLELVAIRKLQGEVREQWFNQTLC
jgi:hypothetical protein